MGRLLKLLAGSGGGSAPFTPASVSGLSLWLDFGDAATLYQNSTRTTPAAADGDPIGGVADKSGLANHAGQPTASKRLTYKTGILNGRSVARFDGVDDFVFAADADSLDCPAGLTAFFVLNHTNNSQFQHVMSKMAKSTWASPFARYCLRAGSGMTAYQMWTETAGNSLSPSAGTAPFGEWGLFGMRYDPAVGQSLFKNGTSIASDSITGAITASVYDLVIGADVSGSPSGVYQGDMAEILLYNAPLSPASRLLVETYLNTKWAVY